MLGMKSNLKASGSGTVFMLLFVGLLLIACSCKTERNGVFSENQNSYSKPAPVELIVGKSGEFKISPQTDLVIRDTNFVNDLLVSLSQPATNNYTHYLFIAPYAFIFVDSEGRVCHAFQFSASSSPECAFWPCLAERHGLDYVVTRRVGLGGIIVPGF